MRDKEEEGSKRQGRRGIKNSKIGKRKRGKRRGKRKGEKEKKDQTKPKTKEDKFDRFKAWREMTL